jgi:hypothetical protein
MEKQLTTKRLSERPRRSSLARRSRLSLQEMDPNYHYRLVNCNLEEDPDRVAHLQEIGYEVVPGKAAGKTGDNQVDKPSALGSAAEVSVGRGTKAIWMRIPKEYFQEDQAAKQAEIDALEQRAPKSADYGSMTIESSKNSR